MRLTHWTDYSLRVLMYCAASEERLQAPTIAEIARSHDISHSHLTKIVMTLAANGYLQTTRGRGGGIRLMRPARDIVVGDVVRLTESDFDMVECFDPDKSQCAMDGSCRLKRVLQTALERYLAVLDDVRLSDLLPPPARGEHKQARPGWPQITVER
ncbi:MAG: Rrf2 family transcriptional regulator [Hydrogenophaga sp.]|jgi:Rrf2 family nitric oxide-sensitive transcriptional repressor|nr:Rrf2 family transcriptional regulator [Hydrogenophaga sp.]